MVRAFFRPERDRTGTAFDLEARATRQPDATTPGAQGATPRPRLVAWAESDYRDRTSAAEMHLGCGVYATLSTRHSAPGW
jgi:hypothetical protein